MPTKIIEGEIVTIRQVADCLKVTQRTIYRLAGRGGLRVLTLTAGSNGSRWKDSPSDPTASRVNRTMGNGIDDWTDSTRRTLKQAGGSPGQAGVIAAMTLAETQARLRTQGPNRPTEKPPRSASFRSIAPRRRSRTCWRRPVLSPAEELVPADARVIHAYSAVAAEAAQTGKSHAVAKTPEAVAETSVLFLEEARKLLHKIFPGKGEHYA